MNYQNMSVDQLQRMMAREDRSDIIAEIISEISARDSANDKERAQEKIEQWANT